MKIIQYKDLTIEKARAGCFVSGMPNKDYHAYEGVSKSGLDQVHKSPAHFAFASPRKATRAMEIGTAIHAAILEPNLFRLEYVLLKDVKARTAGSYKDAVKVHGSERVLVAGEAKNVQGMLDACDNSREVCEAMNTGGFTEVSAFVQCPDTGVLLRCRYDWISAYDTAIDVKKTQDSSPDGFSKSIYNYRYHVQDYFYRHVYELITARQLKFEFLAIEENAPYNPMVYELDDASRLVAEEECKADMIKYAECQNSDDWHGYTGGRQKISLPDWVFRKLENDELEELE